MPSKIDKETQPVPPYISFSTFRTFLDWVSGMPITPSQIDRSLWTRKFGGSTGAQLMTGLRFLSLLEDNRPTPVLENLVRGEAEAKREALCACLVNQYGHDLVENLATMTPKMFSDAISNLGTTSATQRKAERFFIEAAKYVGIAIPDAIARRSRGGPKPVSRNAPQRRASQSNGGETDSPLSTNRAMRDSSAADQAEAQTSLMLWGLFKRLPAPGNKFSSAEREAWIEAAKTLFNLEYQDGEKE